MLTALLQCGGDGNELAFISENSLYICDHGFSLGDSACLIQHNSLNVMGCFQCLPRLN